MTREQRSFCRICLAVCGTVVTVDGDQVVSIRGDSEDPMSKGYVCNKGRGLASLHHDHRLTTSYVRRNGELVPVTLDEALDDAAAALQRVIAEYGPSAVGSYAGGGSFADPMGAWGAQSLKSALGITQSYSTSTVDAISKTFVALEMSGASALLAHADPEPRLLLFMGSNPVISHGHSSPFTNPIERIRQAKEHGAVWAIDPRRTETAALAHRHLTIRPGTDHALLAYLVRSVYADPNFDRAAAAERADGVDELEALVAPFDRERVSLLTDIAAESLDDLVDAVRAAGRLSVVTGTGTTMARRAYLTEWLSWALLILTDSFDQPGGMWFNPGYYYRLDKRGPMRPVVVNGPGIPSHPDILPFMGEWPSSLIPAEIEAGRLKALMVVGSDPATSLPHTDRLHQALRDIDVLLAFNTAPTATTSLATHVFACADQLERPDIPALDLFGTALSTRWTDAVVAPRPEAPEMWRIFAKLAERMGHSLLEEGEDIDTMSSETMLVRTHRGLDPDRLRAANGYLVDAPAVYNWVQSRLPFGKWRLTPERLVAQLAEATDPPPLQLAPRRQGRRINSLEFRAGDQPDAIMNPADAPAGVRDGDLIDVTSTAGKLRLRARLLDTAAVGMVSIPHGWAGVNVNVLIDSEDIDPITGMPVMCGTAVEVHAVEGHAAAVS